MHFPTDRLIIFISHYYHGINALLLLFTQPVHRCFTIASNKWFKRVFYLAAILHSVSAFIEPPSVSP